MSDTPYEYVPFLTIYVRPHEDAALYWQLVASLYERLGLATRGDLGTYADDSAVEAAPVEVSSPNDVTVTYRPHDLVQTVLRFSLRPPETTDDTIVHFVRCRPIDSNGAPVAGNPIADQFYVVDDRLCFNPLQDPLACADYPLLEAFFDRLRPRITDLVIDDLSLNLYRGHLSARQRMYRLMGGVAMYGNDPAWTRRIVDDITPTQESEHTSLPRREGLLSFLEGFDAAAQGAEKMIIDATPTDATPPEDTDPAA